MKTKTGSGRGHGHHGDGRATPHTDSYIGGAVPTKIAPPNGGLH